MKVRPGAPAKAEIKDFRFPKFRLKPRLRKPNPCRKTRLRPWITCVLTLPKRLQRLKPSMTGVLAVEEAEPAEETNVIVLEEIPADEDVTETEDDGNSADAGVYTDKVLTRTEYDDFIAG